MSTNAAGEPGIGIAFSVLGWIVLVIGVAVALIATFTGPDAQGITAGVGMIVTSLGLLGFSALLDRLHKIEFYLRPENQRIEREREKEAA